MPAQLKVPLRRFVIWSALAVIGGAMPATGCQWFTSGGVVDFDTQAPIITVTTNAPTTRFLRGGSLQIAVSGKFAGGPTRATLSLGGTLPPGVTASFSPTTITDSVASVLTLTADATAATGLFTYSIVATETGTTNNVVTTTQMTGQVEPPFVMVMTAGQTVTAGTTTTFNLSAARGTGFSAPISLSLVQSSVPAGSIVTFAPATLTTGNSLLEVVIPINATPGRWLVKAIGTSGSLVDTIAGLLNIQTAPVPPDFTVSSTPSSISVAPGASATYDLLYTRNAEALGLGAITQTVSGLPAGATSSFTAVGTNSSSQLTVATTSGTADGSYPLTITSTLGTIIKTTSVTLVVQTPANFTMALNPASLTVARGAGGSSVLSLQRTGAVGDIVIDAQSVPAGVTVVSSPATASPAVTSTKVQVDVGSAAAPGTYSITVRGIAGALTKTATLTLTIPAPPPSDVTVQLLTPTINVPSGSTTEIPIKLTRKNNAVGQLLELRSTGVPVGGNAWISPSFTTGDSATLYVIGGTAGTSKIVVAAVFGAIPPTDIATVNVQPPTSPDFSVTPAPQTLNMSVGASSTMGVEIGRTNGFTGAVAFTATPDAPGNFVVTFSLNSTTGSGIGMTVRAGSGVSVGPHTIKVRGTSGALSHEVTMTVIISQGSDYPYYPYYPPYGPGLKRPPLPQ